MNLIFYRLRLLRRLQRRFTSRAFEKLTNVEWLTIVRIKCFTTGKIPKKGRVHLTRKIYQHCTQLEWILLLFGRWKITLMLGIYIPTTFMQCLIRMERKLPEQQSLVRSVTFSHLTG